jgi:membrane protein required for colicin V production
MFIDIVCLVLLVYAVFKGWRNGLVVAIFSFLAFVIGLAAALKLSTVAAAYIGRHTNISERWLPFLAFAAVFLIVVLLIRLGAKAIEGFLQVAMLGWANRLGGVILYCLLYLFVFSVILFYADQLHLIKPDTMETSVAYPYLHPLGPKIIDAFAYILPWFKNMFAELTQFFQDLPSKKT